MATKSKQTAAQRSAAAKKAAATRKRNAAKTKAPARSSRKQPSLKQAVARHPFAPGTDVGVYLDAAVAGTKGDPAPDPLSTAKVAKDGSLEIDVPKKGGYVLAGPVGATDSEEEYRRVQVAVR